MLMEQHWKLSYAELHRASDGFSAANLIGAGSFGSVYGGTLGIEGQEVAIKVLNLLNHGAERSFQAECEALRSIRHRNLVKVITACSTVDHSGNDFKALVYEFMPNRDLDKWLHPSIGEGESSSRTLTMAERVIIALDVAEALDYLHHHGHVPIVHCDLKPSNVLLDNDMVAHVGDFGLSRFVQGANSKYIQHTSNTAGIKGTIGYIPPAEGDVYSYGILLLEIFTAKRPTDSLFQEGQSIRSYVATAYPERVMEVADPTLVQHEENDMDEGGLEECLQLVFRLALRCTEESPRARVLIRDAIRELTAILIRVLKRAVSVSVSGEANPPARSPAYGVRAKFARPRAKTTERAPGPRATPPFHRPTKSSHNHRPQLRAYVLGAARRRRRRRRLLPSAVLALLSDPELGSHTEGATSAGGGSTPTGVVSPATAIPPAVLDRTFIELARPAPCLQHNLYLEERLVTVPVRLQLRGRRINIEASGAAGTETKSCSPTEKSAATKPRPKKGRNSVSLNDLTEVFAEEKVDGTIVKKSMAACNYYDDVFRDPIRRGTAADTEN
ncbi:hypothetical protein U9M48_037507 [Paspalum notatum var. saurae]|uniref:Receptor kinase-like protein Xa21 n=1 Tax=Paspalum notatum var. saurae TaxID=547442 RepID=A0AAQ3UF56_PASNO